VIRVHVTVLVAVCLVNFVERFQGPVSFYGFVHENFESSKRVYVSAESENEFVAVEQEVLKD